MSTALLSLIIAAGSAAWIYTKLQNHSGNNTKQSSIAAGVAGGLIFIILLSILNTVL